MEEAHTGSEMADIISPHLGFSRISDVVKNKKNKYLRWRVVNDKNNLVYLTV